jgi:hypothetical protein
MLAGAGWCWLLPGGGGGGRWVAAHVLSRRIKFDLANTQISKLGFSSMRSHFHAQLSIVVAL